MNERLARLYVDDRLAVLAGTDALVRRMLGETKDDEIRAFLEELLPELGDDLRAGERLLTRLGGRPSRLKQAAARAAERLGRLRPNGNWRGYSPLTRLVELESLAVCLAVVRSLWLSLAEVGLEAEDTRRRAERVAARLTRVEALQRLAASVALGAGARRL